MEFRAEFFISAYINMSDYHFKENPEDKELLLGYADAVQRYVDETDFVLVPGKQSIDGSYAFYFNYPNSHTHGLTIVIKDSEIVIDQFNYYGNLTIKLNADGINAAFGSAENICFTADNDGIYDSTLKLDDSYKSSDVAGKISEILSHAKNYYPKAFKAKCAKQREREAIRG